jgi:hypothetical protein
MVSEVASQQGGSLSCGLPPKCSPPPSNAAAGAAVATEFISREFLQSQYSSAFHEFGLGDEDSIEVSTDNWVTIKIEPHGVLGFESATYCEKIPYGQATVVDIDRIVTLNRSGFPQVRAAGSFGVEIISVA